jgi:hypothetical protein
MVLTRGGSYASAAKPSARTRNAPVGTLFLRSRGVALNRNGLPALVIPTEGILILRIASRFGSRISIAAGLRS